MMEKESIASKYKALQSELGKISGKLTFDQFQKIHREFIDLSTQIEQADLYSENERIDELSTSSLEYLLVPYEHGKFIDSNAVSSQLGVDAEALKRNKLRLVVLQIVESIIWKFVSLVILNLKLGESLKGNDEKTFNGIYKWITSYSDLRQREISNEGTKGFVKVDELERATYSNGGPMARREMKINKWKLEKELKEKVKILEDKDTVVRLDEEVVRKIRIDQIALAVIESVGILENTAMEREMLGNIVGAFKSDLNELRIDGLKLTSASSEENDDRKRKAFDKGYTDKVENFNNDNRLISKEGKVLRPFTIVSSEEKRKELKNKVYGTGQKLPTMTVEELVDYELANGGMVKPKEPEPEIDEDNYEWQDKETKRLREWDEFTDTHKKGSGNKMGNLG